MYWRKLFDCGYFGFLIITSIPHCDEKSDKSVQLDDMCHVSQISSSLKPCCAIEIFKSFVFARFVKSTSNLSFRNTIDQLRM